MKIVRFSPMKGKYILYIDAHSVIAVKRDRRDRFTKVYLAGRKRPFRISEDAEEFLKAVTNKKYELMQLKNALVDSNH